MFLAFLAEDLVDQFALAHRLVHLDFELTADGAQGLFVHAGDVYAGVFADSVGHGDASERRLEADRPAVHFDLRRAVHIAAHLLEHLLGELHHPVVILVSHIDLHRRELWVVRAVHALVAEVFRELIDALKAAHNKALQVKLVGNAEVEIDVERVVVCHERAGGGATGYGLQDGCLDLKVSAGVEELAHGGVDFATLDEDLLHVGIDHEVDVTLAIALLGIGKAVVDYTVFLLDHGQWPERFREYGQLLRMDGDLAHLRAENEAADTDEVADVKQLFEYGVV